MSFNLSLVFSALLWFLSLPPYGFPVLSIFAFALPLLYIKNARFKSIILYSYFFTALFQFLEYWWIAKVISKYGDINIIFAVLLTILLSFYLGFFLYFYYLLLKIFVNRYGNYGLIFAPFIYPIFEWLKGKLFGGFPWWDFGYSISTNSYLLQNVRLFGILGLTFLGMMISVSISLIFLQRRERISIVFTILTVVLLFLAFIYGSFSKKEVYSGKSITAGIIEPHIPQDKKWDPQFRGEIITKFKKLSANFEKGKEDIVVLPESSIPVEWGNDREFDEKFVEISKNLSANLIFGAVFEDENGIYNGAIVLNREGKFLNNYKKTHLVPFGEYVPFEKHLTFLAPIVESIGSFTSGTSLSPIKIENVNCGITICYETIFADLIRAQVKEGAEVLVNLSNDAWYEGTPAKVQHFLIDRVRCVETKRFLIRSANGGISGIVSPKGEIVSSTRMNEPSYCEGDAIKLNEKTLFVQIGDKYLILFVIVLAASLAITPRKVMS